MILTEGEFESAHISGMANKCGAEVVESRRPDKVILKKSSISGLHNMLHI